VKGAQARSRPGSHDVAAPTGAGVAALRSAARVRALGSPRPRTQANRADRVD